MRLKRLLHVAQPALKFMSIMVFGKSPVNVEQSSDYLNRDITYLIDSYLDVDGQLKYPKNYCVKSFHCTKNLSELRAETILISNFQMFSCLFLLSTEIDDRCTQFVEATWFYSPQQLTAASQWQEGPGFCMI